ncbi:MAG: MgtC/SapB family protein [Betaproteobacteria bacterium]|nr:MgtC/SapB family protein [Betaproteobacteria bacterium]
MNDIIQALWPWSAFVVSLAIGLLIGLERERSPAAKAGLRTFSLVALAGTIGALLADKTGSPWLLAAGLLILGGMMVAAYQRMPEEGDPGTTTVAAIVVCYGLGAMVWYGYIELALSLAILSTVLLYFKAELRGVSQRLTRTDLVSILQFAVLSLVILPLLPNQDYGPYGVLNPSQIWWMVVLISGISLAGYAALRVAGDRNGALLTGLLGGAVSSTATTLTFARNSRGDPDLAGVAAVVILLANWMVLVRLAIVVAVVSPGLLPRLAVILGGGAAAGLAGILLLWHRLGEKPRPPTLQVQNPAEIRTALTFGGLYALVLFAAAWLSDLAGQQGLYGVAIVSGLTDVDAITLSSLRLFGIGNILAEQAATVILLALLANIAFKTLLASLLSGGQLIRLVLPGMAFVALGLITAWFLL